MFTDSKETSCRRCNERQVGCHSNCENYKQQQKRNEKIRQARKLDKLHLGCSPKVLYSQASYWRI